MNHCFTKIDTWVIPNLAVQQSLQEMAIDGRFGNEGVVLWLGRQIDGVAVTTHLVRLRGPSVTKRPDVLQIDSDLMNEVADIAIESEVYLIGQIHSHGPMHGVELSLTDLRYGIAVPNYLSVVAPDYALRPGTTIRDCGVHVCEANRRFRRLTADEVTERIKTDSTETVPILTVGGDEQ